MRFARAWLTPHCVQDYGVEKDADGDEGVALRATFIISDKGIVRWAEVADLPIGRNPVETVRLVQAFKFSDEHGQVQAPPPSPPCLAIIGSIFVIAVVLTAASGLPRLLAPRSSNHEARPQGQSGVLQDAATIRGWGGRALRCGWGPVAAASLSCARAK